MVILAAALTLLGATPVPVRVAVVCANGSADCGPLETAVTDTLASPAVSVIPAADLAKAFGASEADANAQVDAEKALLTEAENAYYRADWAGARAKIDEAEKLQSAEPLTAGDAPRLLVLRAALDLKQGLKDKAASDAAAAVRLNPDYDASSFPPAVQSVVEKAKNDLPTQPNLTVLPIPADAQASVDGRPVKGDIGVVPGTHTLIVRAPGYATLVLKSVKVGEKDATVRARLSVAVPAAFSSAVVGWLAGGATETEAAPRPFEETAKAAGANVLVALVPEARGKSRAVLFAGGKATASPPLTAPEMADWVKKGLAATGATPTPTPVATKPTPTPREIAVAPISAAGAAAAGAGAAIVPHPQSNPAIAPAKIQSSSKPLTKRPVFWMAVGGAAVAVVAAGVLAGGAAGQGSTSTQSSGKLTVSFP